MQIALSTGERAPSVLETTEGKKDDEKKQAPQHQSSKSVWPPFVISVATQAVHKILPALLQRAKSVTQIVYLGPLPTSLSSRPSGPDGQKRIMIPKRLSGANSIFQDEMLDGLNSNDCIVLPNSKALLPTFRLKCQMVSLIWARWGLILPRIPPPAHFPFRGYVRLQNSQRNRVTRCHPGGRA